MLIGRIIDFIIGKALFEIYLNDPKEAVVLNLLKKNGFYDCRVEKEKINLSCSCADAEVIEKTLSEMKIRHTSKKTGIAYTLAEAKYRIGIVAAIVVCIALNMWFSDILWEIKITGNENIPKDEILQQLEVLGVYEGCRKSGINVPKLTMEYMLKDDRVSFVHLNMKGTTGVLKVAERVKANKTPDKKEVCNIVAKCDGVITRLDVYSGGREVENGQTVVKGQLLISSFFETRLSGHLLKRAKGVAFAKTSPVFEMHIPKEYCKEGGKKKVYEKTCISVLDLSIPLDGVVSKPVGKIMSFEKTERRLSLFGIVPTPVVLVKEKTTVEDTQLAKRTKVEAQKLFDEAFGGWKKKFSYGAELISQEVSFEETEKEYVFAAVISCVESIGIDKPFEIGEN